MHELVIRGGRVVDGTGAPARTADVAIDGGRITEVGRVGPGRREIDADGLLVTPGFVDMHTHYDAQATWDPTLGPSSWHGVTTVVMGNCGVGFAPAAPDRHDWLIGLMEGVEDIPGAAMHEGIQWEWEHFPEYLDALGRREYAVDVGTQIPHGALRAYVMGERGAANEEATPADIAEMARLVREGLEAGALGFSTSRTSLHKSIDGELVPGTFASRDELFGLGRALAEAGHGVFELASEHTSLGKDIAWMRELAAETGRPVIVNLSQTDFAPVLWRDILGHLDAAAEEGVPLFAQVAGRAIGLVMSWHLTAHPFVTYPGWDALAKLTPEARVARLAEPGFKERLLAETPRNLGFFESFVTQAFHKMYPMDAAFDYEPDPSCSVAALAKATGRRPQEIAFDALMQDGGYGQMYFPLFNYADGNLDLLHTMHGHARTYMGLSDGGAHCGAICDAGMPTFMLTHWTRDRSRGPRMSLERVIQRQTRDTAALYGLRDRGVLAPGYRADVNVIDYDALGFERPEVVYDLPAGGRRLVQRARGYVATLVGGVATYEQGQATGALPGRLIRGPRSR